MDNFEARKLLLKQMAEPSDYQPLVKQSYRSLPLTKTVRKVLKLNSYLGITRISVISELDMIGIPVVSTIRPSVDNAQITATQGKGLTVKMALASALMEVVERSAASNYKKITVDSIVNLIGKKQRVLTPAMLGGSSDPEATYDWVKGKDLYSSREIFIPAADVIFPFYPSENSQRPFKPSTTGIASGNTVLEALLSSVNEVVERNATSVFAKKIMGHLLDIETITCPLIKVLLEKFKKANIDVIIFDLSCNAPLPTYYVSVLSNDARGLDIACAGQATHIVPEIALRRALLEAAQSRSVAIQGSREDLIRHDTHWTGSFEYYQQKRQEMKDYIRSKYGFSSMPIPTSINSLFELVTVTLDHLYHNAYKNIIVTDLTEVNVNIPVTHVIIPGMRDTIIEPKRNEHQLNLIESVLTET